MGSFGGKFNPSRSNLSADLTVKGTTPKLTIGDADQEDTMLVFDGNAVDYRIGVDDSSDELEIGVGSAHDTTAGIIMNTDGDVTKIGVQTQTSGHFLKYDGSKYLLAAVSGEVAGGVAADDINAGDAAINLTTTAGNITIDAQGNNTDIIFKGTDATSDITMLTLDGSEAGNAAFNANVTVGDNLLLNTDAAVLSFGVGADVTFTHDNGTGMDITSAGNLDIDCTAGSVTLGASLADGQTLKLGKNGAVETIIAPHGTAGSELYSVINTAGTTDGSDAAGSILLSAVAGGIGLAWADGKDLWAEGGRAVITANEDAADAIKLHADAGTSQTITIVNDAGTSATEGSAAIQLLASAGGINLKSGLNGAGSILLTADGGTSETIKIHADQSSVDGAAGAGAIELTSDAGGISLNAADDKDIFVEAGQVVITANHNTSESIKLHADAGANQTIQIINDAGTTDGSEGAGAIDIEATVGGISLHGADDKDISIEAGQVVLTANHDTAASIKLHADAGTSQTIQLLNDAGTASTAIDIEATAGGFSIDGVQASNITVASAGDADDLTISVTGANDASLILASAGTGTDAVSIDATAGDMVIAPSLADGKTLKLGKNAAVEMVFTPHGTAGNEKFLLTNTAGTADDAIKLTSVAGGVTIHAGNDSLVIDADGTDADAINIDSAGGIDVDAADEINIATTSADGHISLVSAHTSGLAFHIDANADAASEVQIDAGVLDVDVTAGITIDGTTVSIDGTDDSNLTVTASGKDLDIAVAGGGTQELRLASAGTGASALHLNASAGSVDIDSADAITVDAADEIVVTTTSADGHISLVSAHTAGVALHIDANADAGSIVDIDAGILDIDVTGAATLDAASLDITSDAVTFTSANQDDPLVVIQNTTNHANGARLRFVKDKGAAGAADDVAGLIEFYADDASQDQVLFSEIKSQVAVHTNGQEGGKLTLSVASHDGESQPGLIISDGSAEDEVDVTLGNGDGSLTTITGDLKLAHDSANIQFGADGDVVISHAHNTGLTVSLGSNTTAKPIFHLKNTGDLASGPGLRFVADNGAGEGDDDVIGFIDFKGDDSGDAETVYAKMSAIASDVTDGDEGGKIKFEVFAGGIAGTAASTEVLSLGGEDQANSTNCEVVVNEGGVGFVDFRVEGDTETHLLFVDAGSERISIGDSVDAPAATLEITNHASSGATGVPLLQLNSNDVDKEALDINAANTTADVVSITADDCLTTGNALFVDHNDAATSAVSPVTVHLDFDKDGVTGDGVSSGYTLLDLDMNDGATNHSNATVQLVGLDLDIVSANAQGTTQNFGLLVNVSGGASNTAAQLVGDAANQTAVTITNSGNNANRFGLLIQAGTNSISGTPGSNVYAVLKSGDGSATNGIIVNSGASDGNVAFAASSDERLKMDIAPSKVVGLDVLNKIEMSEFRWKKDGSDGPVTKLGFVAQNCEEAYPEMVGSTSASLWTQHGDIDHDVKTITPSELIPVLVKAVQELSESNKELAARIAELENK